MLKQCYQQPDLRAMLEVVRRGREHRERHAKARSKDFVRSPAAILGRSPVLVSSCLLEKGCGRVGKQVLSGSTAWRLSV